MQPINPPTMNRLLRSGFRSLFLCLSLGMLAPFGAVAQEDNQGRIDITSVLSFRDGESVETLRSPTAQFRGDVGQPVTVSFDYFDFGLETVRFRLLDGDVVVDQFTVNVATSGSRTLSYIPTSAGTATLRVQGVVGGSAGEDTPTDSIEFSKIGITLNTPQADEVIPESSRFFIEGSAFLADSFIRQIGFYVRAEPGSLRELMPYLARDKVLFDGRLYQVQNDGTLPLGSISAAGGLTSEDPDVVTTIGGVGFRYIGPDLVEDLAYIQGDFVLSNGRLYEVAVSGKVAEGGAELGLQSSVPSDPNAAPIVEFLEGIVEFEYETTPSPLQSGMAVSPGLIVESGGRYYEALDVGVVAGSNPVLTKTDPSRPEYLNGLRFRYLLVKEFRASAPYWLGELVVSDGNLFEVVTGGTVAPGVSAAGLAPVSGIQKLEGRVGFTYVASALDSGNPEFFPRQYYKYQRIGEDTSSPFATSWSPADVITNPFNWFGPAGYLESDTGVELFGVVTDSRFFDRISPAVPIIIVPAIDPGAALRVAITDPVSGRSVAANTSIQLSAEAKDVNEEVRVVESVQFYVNGVPLDSPDSSFPYTFPQGQNTQDTDGWSPGTAGTYVLNAVAIDTKGNRTLSPDVLVNVTDNAPTVRMISPEGTAGDPAQIASSDTLSLSAFASGSGGVASRITAVDFFSDGNLVATGTADGLGNWTANDIAAQTFQTGRVYTLTARARDANGLTVFSAPTFMTVVQFDDDPVTGTGFGVLVPDFSNPNAYTSDSFGRLTFPDGNPNGTWAFATDLNAWLGKTGDGRIWSAEYGFLNPTGQSLDLESSIFGPITFSTKNPDSGVVWFNSFYLKWVAKFDGTAFFWSSTLNSYLGSTPEGGLWSFSWDWIRPVAEWTIESSRLGELFLSNDPALRGGVYSPSARQFFFP